MWLAWIMVCWCGGSHQSNILYAPSGMVSASWCPGTMCHAFACTVNHARPCWCKPWPVKLLWMPFVCAVHPVLLSSICQTWYHPLLAYLCQGPTNAKVHWQRHQQQQHALMLLAAVSSLIYDCHCHPTSSMQFFVVTTSLGHHWDQWWLCHLWWLLFGIALNTNGCGPYLCGAWIWLYLSLVVVLLCCHLLLLTMVPLTVRTSE